MDFPVLQAISGTLLFAALFSFGLLIVLKPVLKRYALARPNARSSHKAPTPQGGGLAVVASTMTAALGIAAIAGSPFPAPLALVAATALMATVGMIDDIFTIPVMPRLAAQAACIAIVIVALPAELRVFHWLPFWPERLLLLVAGLWFVNLVNFMDGIDWITVTEVVPVTAGLTLLGFFGALPDHAVLLSLALGGAMLGFAPFNAPIARLFLGDVGSLPIGLLLAYLLFLLAAGGQLAAALLLPLYYLADATVTLFRRVARAEPFWNAHRSHFYQRALDRGVPIRAILLRILAVNAALVALALVSARSGTHAVSVVCLASGLAIVGMLLLNFERGRA